LNTSEHGGHGDNDVRQDAMHRYVTETQSLLW